MVVVCAGAKMILDIGLTLEYLETMGVPVLGLRTAISAFYRRKSGFGGGLWCQDEAEVARIAKVKWTFLTGGILVGNPVPEEYAMILTDRMNAG